MSEIKGSAKDVGYEIDDYGYYFKIIYKPLIKVKVRAKWVTNAMNRKIFSSIPQLSLLVSYSYYWVEIKSD